MNRKEVAELLPIIQAYAEGKNIEYRSKGFNEDWKKVTQIPDLSFKSFEYRIKPEQKFRPFKDAEECWCEMLKHEPFGWTCDTFNIRDCITRVTNSGIVYEKNLICFEDVFNKCSFVDGTPFGVKSEEE
jgi:hypothetical protein